MAITAVATPPASGQPKFLRRLSMEVLRQARSGPTPVRKSRNMAIGILTRLKNGGPTLIFVPRIASDSTGKSVPERTATQATRRIRLLKRKLDPREILEP